MFSHALIAGAGGFIGASLRYVVGALCKRWWPASTLPIGTLTVNIVGCLAIGLLASQFTESDSSKAAQVFAITGVLGGFTTYSAFAYESILLGRSGTAFLYVALHLLLGLGARLARDGARSWTLRRRPTPCAG